MALPNKKELELLNKFREMLSDLELADEQQSDMFLVAWLRARDLDLNKANEMLRKSLQWRKEHDIANIMEWEPPAKFLSEFYFEITGQNAEGCPVLVAPFGKWDIRKAVESGNRESWLKYIDYVIGSLGEAMKENSKRTGTTVTQAVVILNFEGFGMRQLTSFSNLNTILEFVRRFESNYPEILHQAIVVNATRVFTLLFRCVKPLLSARTLGKVDIHGTNSEQWKKVLRDNIPPEEYPVELGGTQTGYGSKLQRELHETHVNEEEEFTTHVIVAAGEKFIVEHNIEEAGASLTWRFKTIDYDIGFMIVRNNEQHVYTYRRIDSHLNVQEDSVDCEKLGKYSLIFDNTHSRFREKHLFLYTDVLVPES